MLLLNVVVTILLYVYISNPLYLLNDYIKNLQITNDPDTYLTAPQIIRQYGYLTESHTILTEDGFLLELHRIPLGRTKNTVKDRYPVLFCHGVVSSSVAWVMSGPNTSLAFQLADQGYDVWLMNSRGNTYSRGHIEYTPKQKEFWDFSVHEIGVYDLPATIDHILLVTGHQQLIVVGHSLGNTIFYIMASTLHQYADKVKAQISLAPVTANPHSWGPEHLLGILMPFLIDPIYRFLKEHTSGSILQHDTLDRFILQVLTSIKLFGFSLFDVTMVLNYGFDPMQVNHNRTPVLASHFIEGASIKSLIHITQFWTIGKHSFANFDYGKLENLQRYGTPKPPFYNVSSINTPVRIYYGDNDPIADPIDSVALYQKLPVGVGLIRVNDIAFTHQDFISALDINRLLNDDVLQFIHNFTDTSYN